MDAFGTMTVGALSRCPKHSGRSHNAPQRPQAMLRFLRQTHRRRIVRRHPVDAPSWNEALSAVPMLGTLSSEEQQRLKDLAALFLHQKSFLPVQDLRLTPPMRTMIAAQACYPILNLGIDWYRGWTTIIVYPGQFLRPRTEMDSSGVVHEWTEVLRGESWERGPLVLSWADVAGSGQSDGYNVIIHELAHKLDMLNGEANGFPPLHRSMRPSEWTRSLMDAFRALRETLARGEIPPIDPYAAESPAEYFAVISEYFFELPHLIRSAYPDVYARLAEFYRQDPADRSGNQ